MTIKDEALKLAREALLPHKSTGLRWYTEVDEALDAIDKALAQPEYQSTADKSKLENVPAKGTLLAQPKQEPVGVVALDTSRPFVGGSYNGQVMPWSQAPAVKTVVMFKDLPLNTPLYIDPPQRPWVGLDFETIEECFPEGPSVFEDAYGDNHTSPRWLHAFARAIESRLKEKNR